ncbi:MAG: amidohydrolase [Gemmatimonadota bacterium]|nr:amidohydrolase [Gemmatimonadota bacterium]
MHARRIAVTTLVWLALGPAPLAAQDRGDERIPEYKTVLTPDDARVAALKREAIQRVDGMQKMTQEIVDMVFSFGELGFQELETSAYLTRLLERNGFRVRRGYAGVPTAWVATWGSGKPVIAIGSDIDGIPKASQKPGVAYRDPLIEGGPGHGEGHNSGQAVNITAAIALKQIMERQRIPGTLMLWPGVAEELLGTKAYFVREGLFRDADAAIFTHVGNNLGVSWGSGSGNGMISAEYTFQGTSAHSAGAPWRGRSALDAVELMNAGWNYRREHLRPQHRIHYVIRGGGDQPNVVPQTASVWYYLRETDYPHIQELFSMADTLAWAAGMMTGTRLTSVRILGTAWPQHFNKPIAEAMYENIKAVGLPRWSDADVALARGVQCEMRVRQQGLATELARLDAPIPESQKRGGGSDDIGDVTWTLPTVTLRYPSNIPGLPGHNWTDAIAMATPIAHKGATAGAKVLAATVLDMLLKPDLLRQAWDYFNTVQTRDVKYRPLIRPGDQPAVELNAEMMAKFRPVMRRYYYNPARYRTYLDQLGIRYPTVRACGDTPATTTSR